MRLGAYDCHVEKTLYCTRFMKMMSYQKDIDIVMNLTTNT
ncbi:MAG: hypothetical protein CM15mP65_17890 [Crocinitomicaceae bacterium]|nr:MAG: hypothetical protein CM15mP65_17890 [Crocinitomicaceae bacterium]